MSIWMSVNVFYLETLSHRIIYAHVLHVLLISEFSFKPYFRSKQAADSWTNKKQCMPSSLRLSRLSSTQPSASASSMIITKSIVNMIILHANRWKPMPIDISCPWTNEVNRIRDMPMAISIMLLVSDGTNEFPVSFNVVGCSCNFRMVLLNYGL